MQSNSFSVKFRKKSSVGPYCRFVKRMMRTIHILLIIPEALLDSHASGLFQSNQMISIYPKFKWLACLSMNRKQTGNVSWVSIIHKLCWYLPFIAFRCGRMVIAPSAADSWSLTGWTLAPQESLPIHRKYPVLFARMVAFRSFLKKKEVYALRNECEFMRIGNTYCLDEAKTISNSFQDGSTDSNKIFVPALNSKYYSADDSSCFKLICANREKSNNLSSYPRNPPKF